MVQRQLVIERPPIGGKQVAACVQVNVDDRAAIGPWVTTLAARFGYPLVDAFGAPIAYRLRSISGAYRMPLAGRFADARFPSGCHFVLEPEGQSTVPMQEPARADVRRSLLSPSMPRLSRRALLETGVLTLFCLLGGGAGVTTAFAQRLAAPKVVTMPLFLDTTFRSHQQTVRTVTWAPDGSMVASGDNDGVAFVWKRDGTILYRFLFPAPVRAIAWSPDGGQLMVGAANRVSFFDARTGSLLAEDAEHHTASVTSLGWTQGTVPLALSAGADTRAIVWNASSHQPQVVFRQHTSAIEALATLATTVVTVSDGGLARVWSALTGQEIHGYYAENSQPLRAVAFSSRGNLVIGSDDGSLYLWSDGRTCLDQEHAVFGWHCVDTAMSLQKQTRPVRAIAFSPDGRQLATGGEEKKLILWSMHTMTPLLIQLQQDVPVALSWSPSGQLLAGALGSRVVLWQVPGEEGKG